MIKNLAMRTGSAVLLFGLVLTGCVGSSQATELPGAAPATELLPPPHPAVSMPEEFSALPPGMGRETTIRVCSACHSVELVTEKHLTRHEWFDLVQFMGDRGATGTPAEMTEITDYLAKSFPKD